MNKLTKLDTQNQASIEEVNIIPYLPETFYHLSDY